MRYGCPDSSPHPGQAPPILGRFQPLVVNWGGMRTVLIYRADQITGPWEGRVALQDRGIAQGGLIDTPYGRFGLLLCFDAIIPWTWGEVKDEHGVDFLIVSSLWQTLQFAM